MKFRRFPIYFFLTVYGLLLLPLLGEEDLSDSDSQSDIEEGHSYHGHVFNEGPRQAAVLIPGTGEVDFPVSTQSEEAQLFFNQGIGQLHGYWDFEAERSFRQVAMIDPDCAMAYWGMAMANFKNTTRATGFIEEAVKRKQHASAKEKQYITGLNAYFADPKKDSKERRKALASSLQAITEQFPDDVEAKAFLMRQIYQNSRKGVSIKNPETVHQIAEEIFESQPQHPVHHYVIHLWDYRKPARATESAEKCGPSAPAIAHMWHMPGHTYDKLKDYRKTAWYQEASARVDHAHTIEYQFLPDQIHNFRHNNAWLVKTLTYLGRCDDAAALARNMVELPRLPVFKTKGDSSTYNPGKSSWRSGRQRLLEVLVRFEQWEEWLALEDTPYLRADEKSLFAKNNDKYSAIARFETGDRDGGARILQDFKEQLEAERSREKKSSSKIRDLQSRVWEISTYAALTADPPDIEKAKQYVSKLQRIDKSRHAYLHSRAGNHEKAVSLSKQAISSAKNQIHPLAHQVYVLHRAGKIEEAKAALKNLRKLAVDADRDLPMLERLRPVATEYGYDADWMIPEGDDATAPVVDYDMASLGPFRYRPPEAPDFVLEDDCGDTYRLSDRKGKNTLLIFYLGKGCAHCMEQLNEFAPAMKKYEEAGIDIIAVSSDSPEGLAETFALTEEDGNSPFPFPLLSDSELEIFKAYRAYDDFEAQPLHGTFLIDADQKIRWQDISYEPFMYQDWLLEECQRLLKIES